MKVKYPGVKVQLTGKDGNVFNLIGLVMRALEHAGIERSEVTAWFNEATSAPSYDAVLALIQETVEVS